MPSWNDVAAAAPDLAQRVQKLFDLHRHKTMATLRRDGSPRISGTEVEFRDGEVWLGSMLGARKAHDLLRDPRVAIHSASVDPDDDDPSAWQGDAKIAGRAVEVTDPEVLAEHGEGGPPGSFHLFRVDVTEIALTAVGKPADHLVIDFWTESGGLQQTKRE